MDRRLINRVLNSDATADESRRIVEWFASKRGQEYLSADMDRRFTWGQSSNSGRKLLITISKYAAVIVPLLVLTFSMMYISRRVDLFGNSSMTDIYMPKGESTRVMLSDGSTVYLGSDSHLSFPRKFGLKQRRVSLSGEAHFDVATNKNHPFVVDLEGVDVEVLGTSFDVMSRSDSESIVVSLKSGHVNIFSDDSSLDRLELHPGESATYMRSSGSLALSDGDEQQEYMVDCKSDSFALNHASFTTLSMLLNRRFGVDVVVDSVDTEMFSYNIILDSSSLDQLLKQLENIVPLRFELRDNTVFVTRN